MEKIIIAAVSENFVIGRNGKIPWHSPEELNHFRNTTTGFPVIMGRKTWETLKEPLIDRFNIVVTGNPGFSFSHPNVVICNTISDAFKLCENRGDQKIFIIGGEDIFKQTIPVADKMIISRMKFEAEGENYFPLYNQSEWKLESAIEKQEFIIHTYIRLN